MSKNKRIDPVWFLGPQGPVAQQLSNYEMRPQQIRLAQAIDKAFEQSSHLIAEAGTGIGKSFAYIIPAVSHALKNKQKVVISTYTISLQEQLVYKDIPFIQDACGVKFVATLVKGRSNYLCWRRLEQARKRGPTLFDDSAHIDLVEQIRFWALETQDGSLSSLQFVVPMAVWEMVCSDNNTCMGHHCDHNNTCFYQLARRRMFGCDIMIANHAMLFSDLALRQQGGKILPNFKLVVLDEAHNIENVAGNHFGLRLSNFQVGFMLNRLFNPKTEKGILATHRDQVSMALISKAHQQADTFYNEILEYRCSQQSSGGNGRVRRPNCFANVLSGPLIALGENLNKLAKSCGDEQDRLEINSYGQRCRDFAAATHSFVTQNIKDNVYWTEVGWRHSNPRVVICAAPLHLGATLRQVLFEPFDSVVMTSATLSTSGNQDDSSDNKSDGKGFDFFTSRLGLDEFRTVQLGSPFNYSQQVTVYVESHLPEPNRQEGEFLIGAVAAIKKYLLQTQGKAFVLFTSFKQLNQAAANLEDFCREHELILLIQAKGKDRSSLLDQFRCNINSVLLGTDSFWQGVDVPGESLSNVIIVKLPFSVPDHPLLQARLEQIKSQGGNPFFDYQLPEAILKFKQGFGRLIRTRTDTGIVVVLDPRVITKNYGRAFLDVLPRCPVKIVKSPASNIPENY